MFNLASAEDGDLQDVQVYETTYKEEQGLMK